MARGKRGEEGNRNPVGAYRKWRALSRQKANGNLRFLYLAVEGG
jgi:hypothetical protein